MKLVEPFGGSHDAGVTFQTPFDSGSIGLVNSSRWFTNLRRMKHPLQVRHAKGQTRNYWYTGQVRLQIRGVVTKEITVLEVDNVWLAEGASRNMISVHASVHASNKAGVTFGAGVHNTTVTNESIECPHMGQEVPKSTECLGYEKGVLVGKLSRWCTPCTPVRGSK